MLDLHSLWDGLLIAKALRTIPYNYTRPLPIRQIEQNLRGTIYDPYVRRIMWQGILGKWQDDIPAWLSCPESSRTALPVTLPPSSVLTTFWQKTLSVVRGFFEAGVNVGDTDDDILCPKHWAEAVHDLNCDIVWPAALDEPPYNNGTPRGISSDGEFTGPYLELDTPEYSGVISDQWIVEHLLAQAGIRLAGVLNWLFTDYDVDGAEGFRKRALSVTLPAL